MSATRKITAHCGFYFLGATLLAACANLPSQQHKSFGGVADKTEATAQRCVGINAGLSQLATVETQNARNELEKAEKLSVDELFSRVAVGDSVAQVELGLRYANGKALPLNPDRAFNLFVAAAKQGSADGLFFLGTAYSNGLGIDKNDGAAILIWEDAARQGHPLAQYWLGFMIANGRGGVAADWCAAMPLFESAAQQDVPDAAFMLGVSYHVGYTDLPNYKKAADWYRKATAKQLNQKAQLNLRKLIEEYLVDWQEGDPGKPPPPKPLEVPTIDFKDKSAGNVG